jgi:hypothetical protein
MAAKVLTSALGLGNIDKLTGVATPVIQSTIQAAPALVSSQTASTIGGLFTGQSTAPTGDALCTSNPTYNNAGRTKYFSTSDGKYNCCKPGQTVNASGTCIDVCRADQIRDSAGGCTCAGTAKPIEFGTYCGTTANCPACPSGQKFATTWDCSCTCPGTTWNYNGQCINNTQCPSGYWVKAGVMSVRSINDCTPVVAGQKAPVKLTSSGSACGWADGHCVYNFNFTLDGGRSFSTSVNAFNYDSAYATAIAQANDENNRVDCVMNDWTDTSQCNSGTCTKTQSRTVRTQPSARGTACPTDLTRTIQCASAVCPKNIVSNPCPYGLSQNGETCNSLYPNAAKADDNSQYSTFISLQAKRGLIPRYCKPGEYMGSDGVNCKSCPVNTYQPYNTVVKNVNICAPCPPGKAANPGSASC